jgi:hypothetical protein
MKLIGLRAINRGIAILCVTALVVACTAPSQPLLDHMTMQCADGSAVACNNLPLMQAQVTREKQEQGNAIVGGLLLGVAAAAAGAAAGYAASTPHYYPATEVIVVCPRWSFSC